MYNQQQGRPNYQTYGPVEVANYQSGETYYRVFHVSASGAPKADSICSNQDYYCGDTITYNRQGAVDYAHYYASWPESFYKLFEYFKKIDMDDFVLDGMDAGLTYRNPDYYSYGPNCTNFVSQCLYNGGNLPMTEQWYMYKQNKYTGEISQIEASSEWKRRMSGFILVEQLANKSFYDFT